MKLYEINEAILRLTDRMEVDEDTGELLGNADEICAEIAALRMERKSVLEYLAKLVLNLRAEAAAVKVEEMRLRSRRSGLEKKEARILQILDRECGGEKTDLGVATLNYRKTTRLEVSDAVTQGGFLAQKPQAGRLLPHSSPGSGKDRSKETACFRYAGAGMPAGGRPFLFTEVRRLCQC